MRGTDGGVATAAAVVIDSLGEGLTSLILYGSAVSGGLRPESDIDLLALTARPLTERVRQRVISGLLRVSGRRATDGPARPVELTVMLGADATAGRPLVQLQYGEWLRDEAVRGLLDGPHRDDDAVLLLAMARASGRAVIGSPPRTVIGEIAPDRIRAAVRDVLPSLLEDLVGDERNVVLTLARMQLTLQTGRFAPKDVAAEAVAAAVPEDEGRMLRIAAAAYRGEVDDDWQSLAAPMRSYVMRAAAIIGSADPSTT